MFYKNINYIEAKLVLFLKKNFRLMDGVSEKSAKREVLPNMEFGRKGYNIFLRTHFLKHLSLKIEKLPHT